MHAVLVDYKELVRSYYITLHIVATNVWTISKWDKTKNSRNKHGKTKSIQMKMIISLKISRRNILRCLSGSIST